MRRTLAILGGMAPLLSVAAPGGGLVTTIAKIPDWFIPGEFISVSGPQGQLSGQLCGDLEPYARRVRRPP